MHIAKVSFRNCQSLGSVDYELNAGLNVIVAPDNDGNSVGKSVFFKCLRTAIGANFFDASELVHLISYGQHVASTLFTLSDGSAGGFLAAERKLLYLYKDTADSPIERLTAPHPEFISKMSIIMDAKNKFVLNILDTNQELLFVTSKEDTNFSLLQLVSDNEVLEEIIPVIEEKISDFRAYLGKAAAKNVELHQKLRSFERYDIATMEQRLSAGEQLLPVSRQLLEISESVAAITPQQFKDVASIENRLTWVGKLISLRGTVGMVESGEIVRHDFDADMKMLQVVDELFALRQDLNRVNFDDVLSLNLAEFHGIIEYVKTLLAVQENTQKITTITLADYNDHFVLQQIGANLSSLRDLLDQYNSGGQLQKDSATAVMALEAELQECLKTELVVVCPVKGKVVFSADGKCEECGDIRESGLCCCD